MFRSLAVASESGLRTLRNSDEELIHRLSLEKGLLCCFVRSAFWEKLDAQECLLRLCTAILNRTLP